MRSDAEEMFPEGTEPHEAALFKAAILAWADEVDRTFGHRSKRYTIELSKCPVLEINDQSQVRQFLARASATGRGVEWVLTDPIRAADPAVDPVWGDDNVVFVYPDGWPGESRRGVPERMLEAAGFLIPRKYREGLLGDLHEDVADLRACGYGERCVTLVIAWQLCVAVAGQCWPFLRKVLMVAGFRDVAK